MTTRRLAATITSLSLALAVFYGSTALAQVGGMGQTMGDPLLPRVKGLYKGQEILFVHTEASDAQVARMLTRMMGPKVITVPGLARIPRDLLADVYVFTNGVKGDGPFDFQVDVFDAVPGDARYTPLRAVTLVTWQAGSKPRLLRSVEEIQAAIRHGEVTAKRPGIVVNMPIIVWPGGQR